jgi:hypothetical protein
VAIQRRVLKTAVVELLHLVEISKTKVAGAIRIVLETNALHILFIDPGIARGVK